MKQRANAGFTLLEVLVAVAIFALIGIASHRLLVSAIRVDTQTREQEQQLRQLLRAMNSLERDVEQAVARPVLVSGSSEEPAFRSDPDGQGLQWTRAGWSNPQAAPRAQLQRVHWRREGTNLLREYWPVLDRADDSAAQRQQVLQNISALQWRYLDRQGIWRMQWQGTDTQPLPRALEMRIEHPRFGALRRVLLLPAGSVGSQSP
ncbi:MAG: type II secretion system minor pseudopilin GspJ [Stenotrophomonas sp.]